MLGERDGKSEGGALGNGETDVDGVGEGPVGEFVRLNPGAAVPTGSDVGLPAGMSTLPSGLSGLISIVYIGARLILISTGGSEGDPKPSPILSVIETPTAPCLGNKSTKASSPYVIFITVLEVPVVSCNSLDPDEVKVSSHTIVVYVEKHNSKL